MLNCCERELPAGPIAAIAAIQITNQRPRTSRLWLRTQSVSAAIDPLPEFLSVRKLRPFIVTPLPI
jgi:hypothetical protein